MTAWQAHSNYIPGRKRTGSIEADGNEKTENSGKRTMLWHKIRRRRIYQITRFSLRILRELCTSFLIEGAPNILAVPDPPLTSFDIKDSTKFELATYLAKFFEKCYLVSMDTKQSKEIRLEHFHKLQEVCSVFDEKFTQTVLYQCRVDNSKLEKRANNISGTEEESNSSGLNVVDQQKSKDGDLVMDKEIPNNIVNSSEKFANQSISHPAQAKKNPPAPIDENKKKSKIDQEENKKETQKENEQKIKDKKVDDAYIRSNNNKKIMERIVFQADIDRFNHSVHSRHSSVQVSYDSSKQIIPPWEKRALDQRLASWEPFWKVQHDFSNKQDCTGIRMAPIERFSLQNDDPTKPYRGEELKSCLKFSFTIPDEVKSMSVQWGKRLNYYKNDDVRLILRMMPLHPPKSNYKADTHIWPKGTFIQINSKPIPDVKQRRQQIHDESLWKGNCHALDLTQFCSINSGQCIMEIASLEYDSTNPYGVQLAICRYNHPDTLLETTLRALPEIPYSQALEKAMKYTADHTVSIDESSDDELTPLMTQNSLSLNCPISMTAIKIPVRGKECRHLQCYDLASFIHSNSFPSGRRWRCIGCDSLLNLQSLVKCGLLTQMVDERMKILNEASVDRSKVILYGNGRWTLDEVKKEFMTNTIRGAKRKAGVETQSKESKKKPGLNDIICL